MSEPTEPRNYAVRPERAAVQVWLTLPDTGGTRLLELPLSDEAPLDHLAALLRAVHTAHFRVTGEIGETTVPVARAFAGLDPERGGDR